MIFFCWEHKKLYEQGLFLPCWPISQQRGLVYRSLYNFQASALSALLHKIPQKVPHTVVLVEPSSLTMRRPSTVHRSMHTFNFGLLAIFNYIAMTGAIPSAPAKALAYRQLPYVPNSADTAQGGSVLIEFFFFFAATFATCQVALRFARSAKVLRAAHRSQNSATCFVTLMSSIRSHSVILYNADVFLVCAATITVQVRVNS